MIDKLVEIAFKRALENEELDAENPQGCRDRDIQAVQLGADDAVLLQQRLLIA